MYLFFCFIQWYVVQSPMVLGKIHCEIWIHIFSLPFLHDFSTLVGYIFFFFFKTSESLIWKTKRVR